MPWGFVREQGGQTAPRNQRKQQKAQGIFLNNVPIYQALSAEHCSYSFAKMVYGKITTLVKDGHPPIQTGCLRKALIRELEKRHCNSARSIAKKKLKKNESFNRISNSCELHKDAVSGEVGFKGVIRPE